jgi:uncharacterized protein (TIGR00730 family)
MPWQRICVFAGSADGTLPAYIDAACALGRHLAESGIGVVYGGASIGLMGRLADAALAAGGEVIGVLPHGLSDREIAHAGLTELRLVATMHERKALMADLADAFIALPGGLGTLEELFEIATWAQLGLHAKPVGLLDVAGYYAPLTGFLEHAVAHGFIKAEQRARIRSAPDVATLLTALRAPQPASQRVWLSAGQR